MKKISIKHLSNNHSDWLRALDFYKQEVSLLKERLTEIAGKNTGGDTLAQVEHFENQFKVQADNIDTLSHNIRQTLAETALELQQDHIGYVDENLLMRHDKLQHDFDAEEKVVLDLRKEFNRFAATWM